MQLPRGKVLREALPLEKTDMPKLFYELELKKFNGYVAVLIRGNGGYEEGVVVFLDGKVVSSSYEYLAYQREFFGVDAIKRFANLCRADSGIYDIIQLSKDLGALVLRLNPESELKYSYQHLRDDSKGVFDYNLEKEAKTTGVVTKEDILSRFKLSDIVSKR